MHHLISNWFSLGLKFFTVIYLVALSSLVVNEKFDPTKYTENCLYIQTTDSIQTWDFQNSIGELRNLNLNVRGLNYYKTIRFTDIKTCNKVDQLIVYGPLKNYSPIFIIPTFTKFNVPIFLQNRAILC
jgi:hypothetical protein